MIERGHRAAAGHRVLLGGELVVPDADEIGADAELLQRPAEVHVRGGEAGEAEAARGVHGDAVGLGADEEGLGAGVLEVAKHLLAAGAQAADGVGDLLGVGDGARGLGAELEDDARDLGIVGEAPQALQQARVAADARRIVDAEADDLARERNPRLAKAAVGGAQVEARAGLGDGVAEDTARGDLESVDVHVDAGHGEEATLAVGEDGEIAAEAADARDVDPDRAMAADGFARLVEGDIEAGLDSAAAEGAEGEAPLPAPLDRDTRRADGSVPVAHREGRREPGQEPRGDAAGEREIAVEERALGEPPANRGAKARLRVPHREAPAEPVIAGVKRGGRAVGRAEQIEAKAGGEGPNRQAEPEGHTAVGARRGRAGPGHAPAQLGRGEKGEVGGVASDGRGVVAAGEAAAGIGDRIGGAGRRRHGEGGR